MEILKVVDRYLKNGILKSMPILSFILLFGKPDNWRQMYKQGVQGLQTFAFFALTVKGIINPKNQFFIQNTNFVSF